MDPKKILRQVRDAPGAEAIDGLVLAHIMVVRRKDKRQLQAGFYDAKANRMITATVDDPIVFSQPEKIFEGGAPLERLDLDAVTIGFEQAMKSIGSVWESKYSQHPIVQQLLILQMIDSNPVYNATLFTQTMQVLNCKIDARDGSVNSESFGPLATWDSSE